MTSLPRLSIPEIPLHIIQRGNNYQVYFDPGAAYAYWLHGCLEKYHVALYARMLKWC